MKTAFRLVCEDCLHSFVDESYKLEDICLECGGCLIAIKAHKGVVDENTKDIYRPLERSPQWVC